MEDNSSLFCENFSVIYLFMLSEIQNSVPTLLNARLGPPNAIRSIQNGSRFEVFTNLNVQNAVFWSLTPCTLGGGCRRLGGTYYCSYCAGPSSILSPPLKAPVITFLTSCLYNPKDSSPYKLRTWWMRYYVTPKRRYPPKRLHRVTTLKNPIRFIDSTVILVQEFLIEIVLECFHSPIHPTAECDCNIMCLNVRK
jgi:hypothetical protein